MLEDPKRLKDHPAAMRAMARAGGVKAGPDLTAALEAELAFWMKTAPKLKRGWWNGTGLKEGEGELLRDHYDRTSAALWGLGDVRFAGSRKVVTALRDFW